MNMLFAAAVVLAVVRPYVDPQPSWPPHAYDNHNGRRIEFLTSDSKPEWGYDEPREDICAVVHPKVDRLGAPLVVVLHSAGHDLMTCLKCARQIGNHDIYRTPDDMYALYLDCAYNRKTDWWWGDPKREFPGFDLTPTEKRLMDTVRWAIATYGIDENRVYLCGNSMGGSGTLGLGLRHGDVFAAIKANVPAGVEHACNRLGDGGLPAEAVLPDPPVCVDYSSQTDTWSKNHERLIRLMHDRKYPFLLFWGCFGHDNNNETIAQYNDIIHDFDWLSVRKDEAYPVFTDATCDNAHPWPVQLKADGKNPVDTKPGQINGFFRWKALTQSADRLEMKLWLAALETKFAPLRAPEKATAVVSLRRLGALAPKAGERLSWRFGGRQGAAEDAVVTLGALEIARQPQVLTVTKEAR